MKIFAIRSDSMRKSKNLAYLIYYENEKTFYIELPEDADEWETPLMLSAYLKKGEKTVNAYHSKMWVQQRIVPPDRQNLGQILKDNNLKEYDEFSLLMLSKGRCAQDDYYLHPVTADQLPADFAERFSRRVDDIIPLKNGFLLVFFRNGEIKKCDIRPSVEKANCTVLLSNRDLFCSVEILTDGYGIGWGSLLSVSNESLFRSGKTIDLSLEDFKSFVENRVITLTQAAEILNCTKQNISDLIKRGKLNPIASNSKTVLLLKNEVLQRKWE